MEVEARAIFSKIDRDGDGNLSPLELLSGLSDFGVPDAAIEMLFIQLDADGDGQISLDEWLDGFVRYQKLVGANTSAETFPPVLAVLRPVSENSAFAGDGDGCAVCLSMPFQPRRFDCPAKHLLCEACTVAWAAHPHSVDCPVCPPGALPAKPEAPQLDKNTSASLQATLVCCPVTGRSVRLKELRPHIRSLMADQGQSGLLVPNVLLSYTAESGAAEAEEPAAAEPDRLVLPALAAAPAPAAVGGGLKREQPWPEPASPAEAAIAEQQQQYEERLAAALSSGTALFSLADSWWLSGEDELLLGLLENLVDDSGHSKSVEGLGRLGASRLRCGQFEAALKVFDQAIALNPDGLPPAREHTSPAA